MLILTYEKVRIRHVSNRRKECNRIIFLIIAMNLRMTEIWRTSRFLVKGEIAHQDIVSVGFFIVSGTLKANRGVLMNASSTNGIRKMRAGFT